MIPGCPRLHERAVASADFDAAVTHAGILHIQRAPAAPEPRQWLEFLGQLWGPDDQEAINTLQEVFGYCLTGDTGQQKAFLLVGPKRSGKGTIARVLARLVGIGGNAVAPTLAALGTNFGLAHRWPRHAPSSPDGKRVAIISDARLGARADQHAITERLLSITGEDAITIDRKYLPAWTGQLQTRFLVISNELPRLADASGALASRFIVMLLSKTFLGREDQTLTGKLLTEQISETRRRSSIASKQFPQRPHRKPVAATPAPAAHSRPPNPHL